MRLGFPVDLFRSVLDEERLSASAIMRITYDLQGTPRTWERSGRNLVPHVPQPIAGLGHVGSA